MKSYDVIVIGAGHNGIVAAASLAKSGKSVLVLEAGSTYGGMACFDEFVPGYSGSPLVHTVDGLSKNLIDQLALETHGYEANFPTVQTHCLSHEEPPLTLSGSYMPVENSLSALEAKEWNALYKRLSFQSGLLQRFFQDAPPQEDSFPVAMKTKLAKTAFDLKRSGKVELQEFLRMAMMCIADVLDETLSDDRLKGLLSFDATLGINLGPRSPTSLFGLYYRLASIETVQGHALCHSLSASQNLISTLYNSAKSAGVDFKFGENVSEIMVQNGAAIGVRTIGQTEFRCGVIISAIHRKTPFGDLVGASEIDTGFARDVRTIRYKGNVSKLNLVLDRYPGFDGITSSFGNARFVYAPSVNHVEQNFNPSKYGELPDDPCFEFVLDKGENGRFYLSAQIQNTPYVLKQGWKTGKRKLQKSIFKRLESLSPGIGKTIIASDLLSPLDIETRFHVPGGHWHHGELQMDRVFSLRSVFGAANYRTPIDQLYICGAGTHPGGRINGVSGLNAAKAVAADERKQK